MKITTIVSIKVENFRQQKQLSLILVFYISLLFQQSPAIDYLLLINYISSLSFLVFVLSFSIKVENFRQQKRLGINS